MNAPPAPKNGSPLSESHTVSPSGPGRCISKSRKGSCRASCARWRSQSASVRLSAGWSQRLRPRYAAASRPVFSIVDMKVSRNCSSCSQYQSEESAVRLRKRASLSCNALSAAMRSRTSREIAAMTQPVPERSTRRVDSKGNCEPSLHR